MRARLTLIAAVAIAVAGCGSSGGPPAATSGPSTGPTSAATVPATTTAATAPATPGATAAGGGTVAVDLTFAGTYPLTAKGSAGQCEHGTSSTGAPLLSFTATGADYAGLGSSFNLTEAPNGQMSVKWLATSSLAWASIVTGVTFSADHRTMIVDFTFPGISNPESVKGTIFCP